MNEDAIESLKDIAAATDEIADAVGDLRPPAILLGDFCIPINKITYWTCSSRNPPMLQVQLMGMDGPLKFCDLTGHLRKTLQQTFRFLLVSEDD